MLELILNAAKLVLSDDARKSTAALLRLAKRTPQWKESVCTLEASVERRFAEQVPLISGVAVEKLRQLGYSDEGLETFKTVFMELTRNAFEHGCTNDCHAVRVVVAVTEAYAAITVINRRGARFSIDDVMADRSDSLGANRYQRRGRGLLLLSELADTIEGTANGRGVKAVLYKDRVVLRLVRLSELCVIDVLQGLHNPSFQRRLVKTALLSIDSDLLIDFRRWRPGTVASFVVLQLDDLFRSAARRIVALIHPEGSEAEIYVHTLLMPPAVIATSLKEALDKLGKPHLANEPALRKSRLAWP